MAVRASAAQFISLVRDLIGDNGPQQSQQFVDQQIQDSMDRYRDDVNYELLAALPAIVNDALTSNIATVIWSDYKSKFQYWEADVVVQGNQIPGAGAWIVLNPGQSDYLTGRFTFVINVFTAGTAPGQYPPVFLRGKIHDVYMVASDLSEMWAAQLSRAYDVSAAGVHLSRSHQQDMLHKQADYLRSRARIRTRAVRRDDAPDPGYGQRVPILGSVESLNY